MKRFDVGARVVEPTYGLGSVVAVEDAYTRVQFDEHGVKKFLTSMSKLEPSDEPVPAGARGAKTRKKRVTKKAVVAAAPAAQPTTTRADPYFTRIDTDIPSPDGDDDRRPQRRVLLDRVEEIPHLAALVDDVVGEEQPARVEPRVDHVEEPLVVLLPRVEEDEVERPGELRDLLRTRRRATTCTMSERPARWMFSASSFARDRVVLDRDEPAAGRRAAPCPIQIAL